MIQCADDDEVDAGAGNEFAAAWWVNERAGIEQPLKFL